LPVRAHPHLEGYPLASRGGHGPTPASLTNHRHATYGTGPA
jgi:hypothetical protein